MTVHGPRGCLTSECDNDMSMHRLTHPGKGGIRKPVTIRVQTEADTALRFVFQFLNAKLQSILTCLTSPTQGYGALQLA